MEQGFISDFSLPPLPNPIGGLDGHGMLKVESSQHIEEDKKMNELQVINISGVDGYEKDGVVYLRLENVARGLGFTQEKNGVEYVRWDRVEDYLAELGFPHKWGKDGFIPENIVYRLAMKAKNEVAEAFQAKIADEVIPSIRRTGGYGMTVPAAKKAIHTTSTPTHIRNSLKIGMLDGTEPIP